MTDQFYRRQVAAVCSCEEEHDTAAGIEQELRDIRWKSTSYRYEIQSPPRNRWLWYHLLNLDYQELITGMYMQRKHRNSATTFHYAFLVFEI